MIGIYAQKNKTLESEVKTLSVELTKAKEMLKNVEKYWSHQVIIYAAFNPTSFFQNSFLIRILWINLDKSKKIDKIYKLLKDMDKRSVSFRMNFQSHRFSKNMNEKFSGFLP